MNKIIFNFYVAFMVFSVNAIGLDEPVLDKLHTSRSLSGDALARSIAWSSPSFQSVGEFVVRRGPYSILGEISSASGIHLGNGIVVTSKHVWDVNGHVDRIFGKQSVRFRLPLNSKESSYHTYQIRDVVSSFTYDEGLPYGQDIILLRLQRDDSKPFPEGIDVSFARFEDLTDREIINVGYPPSILGYGYFGRYDHHKRGVVSVIASRACQDNDMLKDTRFSKVGYRWIEDSDPIKPASWISQRLRGEVGMFHGMSGGGGFLWDESAHKMQLISLNTAVLPLAPIAASRYDFIHSSYKNVVAPLIARGIQLPVFGYVPECGQMDIHLPFSVHEKEIKRILADAECDTDN